MADCEDRENKTNEKISQLTVSQLYLFLSIQKAYKRLYKLESARQPGTLYHAKCVLQRSSINGKVKSRFKAHHELMMVLGKSLIKENLLEFFGMETENAMPSKEMDTETYEKGKKWMAREEKSELLHSMIYRFIECNGYLHFDINDGGLVSSTDDKLYNYCNNLCHWYMQLLEMDDTAKDGDVTRVLSNCMNAIPFFFSHSRLSKYFVENIDYILKCEHLLSPLQRMRVLEGSFVNMRGGARNNMEADLMQENSVKCMKNLIRQLGANKTTAAIERSTAAAEAIQSITDGIDLFMNTRKVSTRHHKITTYDDEKILARMLRKCRPFHITHGRKCPGFDEISSSPFSSINLQDFKYRINQVVERLSYGQAIVVDDEREGEEEDSSDED